MPTTNKSDSFGFDHRNDKSIKKIARNTWRYTDTDGAIVTRLHRTDIARQYPDGRVIFNTGGYRSMTTKDRMDGIGGYRVYQNKGVWYVSDGQARGNVAVFFDGIVLPDEFKRDRAKEKEKQELILFKRINKFCRVIRDMPTLPMPSGGDCFICMMQKEKPVASRSGGTMGHARENGQTGPVHDTEHLYSHMDEGYVPGQLLVNALRWDGMSDTGISMMLDAKFMRAPHDMVAGKVRRYLKRKLGVG